MGRADHHKSSFRRAPAALLLKYGLFASASLRPRQKLGQMA